MGRRAIAILAIWCLLRPSVAFATYIPITVEEQDASPSVTTVKKLKVNNGSLTDNGSGTVSLVTGTTPPGGSDTYVQYNNAGSFGGDAGFIYNATTDSATLGGTVAAGTLTEGGNAVPNVTDTLSVFAATTSLQLLGVLSDETGSGAAVFATSPTFTTSLTSPLVLGGTATTSDLALQTTSGVGAAGADMHFLVGNNGATEALTILNSGNVGIGTTAPGALLDVRGAAIFNEAAAVSASNSRPVPRPAAGTPEVVWVRRARGLPAVAVASLSSRLGR